MPKKSRKMVDQAEAEPSTVNTESETQPILSNSETAAAGEQDSADYRNKIDKSGLYDTQQVKRMLDDEVIAFMEDAGYEESVAASNVKLLAGTIAVAAALYSHFGVGEWVHSRPAVLACVVVYLVCTAAINLSSMLFEASAMYVGHLGPVAKRAARGKMPNSVWVHTNFVGRGSSEIKVEVRRAARSRAGSAEHAFPYEKFITTEGHFLKDSFRKEMQDVLGRVQGEGKKKN